MMDGMEEDAVFEFLISITAMLEVAEVVISNELSVR